VFVDAHGAAGSLSLSVENATVEVQLQTHITDILATTDDNCFV